MADYEKKKVEYILVKSSGSLNYFSFLTGPRACIPKDPVIYPTRKAIFSSSVSKNGEVNTPPGNFLYERNLCSC